jgi:hypothetical protein
MSVKTHYLSYLLRIWVSQEGGSPDWRVSLENTRTGERLAFSSLERLLAFLQDQGEAHEQEDAFP